MQHFTTLSDGENDFDTGLGTFTIPLENYLKKIQTLLMTKEIDARLAVNYRSSYLDYLGDEGEA